MINDVAAPGLDARILPYCLTNPSPFPPLCPLDFLYVCPLNNRYTSTIKRLLLIGNVTPSGDCSMARLKIKLYRRYQKVNVNLKLYHDNFIHWRYLLDSRLSILIQLYCRGYLPDSRQHAKLEHFLWTLMVHLRNLILRRILWSGIWCNMLTEYFTIMILREYLGKLGNLKPVLTNVGDDREYDYETIKVFKLTAFTDRAFIWMSLVITITYQFGCVSKVQAI